MGLQVKGYEPTKADLERVEALKREQTQTKEPQREPGRAKEPTAKTPEMVPASELRKHVMAQTKELSKESIQYDEGPGRSADKETWYHQHMVYKSRLDGLYQDQYALEKLGNKEVAAVRGKDGRLEVADSNGLRQMARETTREHGMQREQSLSRGRGR
jgi:hypothetical protein